MLVVLIVFSGAFKADKTVCRQRRRHLAAPCQAIFMLWQQRVCFQVCDDYQPLNNVVGSPTKSCIAPPWSILLNFLLSRSRTIHERWCRTSAIPTLQPLGLEASEVKWGARGLWQTTWTCSLAIHSASVPHFSRSTHYHQGCGTGHGDIQAPASVGTSSKACHLRPA